MIAHDDALLDDVAALADALRDRIMNAARARGDTTVMCRPGDFYTIALGTAHAARVHERTVLLDVYAPNHIEFERQYSESAALQ